MHCNFKKNERQRFRKFREQNFSVAALLQRTVITEKMNKTVLQQTVVPKKTVGGGSIRFGMKKYG